MVELGQDGKTKTKAVYPNSPFPGQEGTDLQSEQDPAKDIQGWTEGGGELLEGHRL